MNFIEKLTAAVRNSRSLVCVGLDPDPTLMPPGTTIAEFNRGIVDSTSDIVCAYKPNLAFYEALGDEGMSALKATLKHIPTSIPVIADAKRSDIGNTASAYARALFDVFGFDACTVNAYLGHDSVEPFLRYADKGIFILCRTSNAGAADFQSLRCETPSGTRPLFEVVAQKAHEWNVSGNIGLVVGATYPDELKLVRTLHPDMPFLIPGIGAQGGDIGLTMRYGTDTSRERTIINSSRQIIYASPGRDFAQGAREATLRLREQINRALTPGHDLE